MELAAWFCCTMRNHRDNTKQVLSSSWDGRPFGHNCQYSIDIVRKLDEGCAPSGEGTCGWAGFPCNTLWYDPRPIPSHQVALIQPVWPQQTWVENWGAMPFLGWGLGPRLAQCGLGWDLPPYQVAFWSIHPFGHNRYRPKTGGRDCAPFGVGGAGSPFSTKWPGPRPTSIPSGILIIGVGAGGIGGIDPPQL